MGFLAFLDSPTPHQSAKAKKILTDNKKSEELMEAVKAAKESQDNIGRMNGVSVRLVGMSMDSPAKDQSPS